MYCQLAIRAAIAVNVPVVEFVIRSIEAKMALMEKADVLFGHSDTGTISKLVVHYISTTIQF